jgi:hypothetical protein
VLLKVSERMHFSSGACRVLPEAAGTLLAPTSAVNMCIVERLLMFENTGRSAPKPHKLYAVRGFPAEHMLAAPQPMEWLEFNEYMPPVSTRIVTFETVCAGGFEGLHMHLQVRTADCHCLPLIIIDCYGWLRGSALPRTGTMRRGECGGLVARAYHMDVHVRTPPRTTSLAARRGAHRVHLHRRCVYSLPGLLGSGSREKGPGGPVGARDRILVGWGWLID